jgi:hypothetical protein
MIVPGGFLTDTVPETLPRAKGFLVPVAAAFAVDGLVSCAAFSAHPHSNMISSPGTTSFFK